MKAQQSIVLYKVTRNQSTSSPEEDQQYAVETSRSTSHVTKNDHIVRQTIILYYYYYCTHVMFAFLSAPTSRVRRLLLWFKKRNSLPYYFVYVAWVLVFIFSTGSAAVVVFYGMEFKNLKSLQWLFSSCVSFVQDVFITQPLKVRISHKPLIPRNDQYETSPYDINTLSGGQAMRIKRIINVLI